MHCRWRRGMTRRCQRPPHKMLTENKDKGRRSRTRSATHLKRTTYDREMCVLHSWRVSQQYMSRETIRRAQRCQKRKVLNTKYIYIGSQDQKHRMAYIYALRCTLYQNGAPNSIPNRALNMLYISAPTCDTTASKLKRAPHPARDRGDRPGRPAGPGLPYGDCTGDGD